MAKFANVNVDSVRYFQTTDFTHLHRMSNLIDYIRSVYRNLGRDTRLMTLPQDGTISMIEYFTRFRDDILQRARLTCFEELTVFHLLSYMGKKGYENGIGAMSAEERMAASEKGYENGIGAMSAEERMAKAAKWTVEVDASIERMIDDGVSFAKIASKLGNGLSTNDISNRWYDHLKESSGITKPPVPTGFPSRITWTAEDDATIVRMRAEDISFAKIASELGNGLKRNDIKNRRYRILKDKLQ